MKTIYLISLSAAILIAGCGGGGSDLPEPAPVISPAITSIVPSQISLGKEANNAQRFELRAGMLSLSGQKLPSGAGELAINAYDGIFSLIFDPTKGMAIIEDDAEKLRVVSESSTKGTVIRTYSYSGDYIIGYFIENTANGSKRLWRLIDDGSTEPSNLTNGRVLGHTRLQPMQSVLKTNSDRLSQLNADISCYGIMNPITSATSDYGNDVGDALDSDDAPREVRRVGRFGKFIGSIISNFSSLCPDAPDPITEADLSKEIALETAKAIGPSGVRSVLEKYSNINEFIDNTILAAEQLQEAIKALPINQRNGIGSATNNSTITRSNSLSQDLKSVIDNVNTITKPVRIYVGNTLICIQSIDNGGSTSYNWSFLNNCAFNTVVQWCTSDTSGCNPNLVATVLAGDRYTNAGSGSKIRYGACPREYEGRLVSLTPLNNGYYCSYSSR